MSADSDLQKPLPYSPNLPPPDFFDPVVEAYKKDVDMTLIRENLKLTVTERFEKHQKLWEFAQALRAAGQRMREGR
ncbi:MAG: hypothetical protein EXS16_21590 [Gemmataceae bacterium]|nr:hypothetical protein [Gemmataceae bacterium]